MLTHIHPSLLWFTCEDRPKFNGIVHAGSASSTIQVRHVPRAPLPGRGVISTGVTSHASRQKALPLLHHSYGLMRQSKTLLPTSIYLIRPVLCRLLPVSAGRWTFPTLSLQSLHRCLDPYPGMPLWCPCSFFPESYSLTYGVQSSAHPT